MATSVNTPLANFPGREGDPIEERVISVPKMTVPTTALLQQIQRYNRALTEGDMETCAQILNEHPELKRCRLNTDDYNRIIDEIKALQVYYLEEVETYIRGRIGIDDTALSNFTTFSSNKIKGIVNSMLNVQTGTIYANNSSQPWTKSGNYYKQDIKINGVTTSVPVTVAISIPSTVTTGDGFINYQEAASYIVKFEQEKANYVTAYCFTKPSMNLSIQVTGIVSVP